MSNIGRIIHDHYCSGFAGRRYDLEHSRIEAEADDYIIVRTRRGEPVMIGFFDCKPDGYVNRDSFKYIKKQRYIDSWCSEKEEEV